MARKSKSQEAQDATPKFVVAHDALGEWRRGEVVFADELPLAEDGGVDQDNIDRLIEVGAIVPHKDAEDALGVPETQTLAEAVRSDSPPTLPVVPASVDTTPAEIAKAVDPSNTFVTGKLPGEA